MIVAVRCCSRNGNTRRVAEVIASTLNTEALSTEHPILQPTDLLFLGSGVYAGDIDKRMKQFIRMLDPAMVNKAVCFSTSAVTNSAYRRMADLLADVGIRLLPQEFHCAGSFGILQKGHPDRKDLDAAKDFAKKISRL
ncbi:MAG: flavodoxin [Erysipelotrichia bacterium]|nr:flavodoxin [Erysipelotrichia bacterium]